jgi:hypothetical protein
MHKIHSLSSVEFQRLFSSYKSSAFRLETLQTYAVSYEDKPFQDFLAGKKRYTDSEHIGWVNLIRANIMAGKTMSRVHLIQEPLTDYLKFEILWPYRDNVDAGDDIRLVVLKQGEWPTNLPKKDFWLFDESLVADMKYDEKYGFVEAVITDDPKIVDQRIQWRNESIRLSISYEDYLKRMK